MMAESKAESEKAAMMREESRRRVEKELFREGPESERGEFDDVFDDWANPLGL